MKHLYWFTFKRNQYPRDWGLQNVSRAVEHYPQAYTAKHAPISLKLKVWVFVEDVCFCLVFFWKTKRLKASSCTFLSYSSRKSQSSCGSKRMILVRSDTECTDVTQCPFITPIMTLDGRYVSQKIVWSWRLHCTHPRTSVISCFSSPWQGRENEGDVAVMDRGESCFWSTRWIQNHYGDHLRTVGLASYDYPPPVEPRRIEMKQRSHTWRWDTLNFVTLNILCIRALFHCI